MKKRLIPLLCILSAALASPLAGAPMAMLGSSGQEKIVVNNRILAKVNGKPISVIDVMKKMDMLFYKQFPEYTSSIEARHQFYSVNWKYILDELINKELMLADAEEAKMEVNAGDVRQEMENVFGPNIYHNLDKVGLSYEEASRMIQGDLTLRRVMFIRVNAKAIRQVTPQAIRGAYEELAKSNIRPDEWHYRTITIRDKSATKGAESAHQAYLLLTMDGVALEDLPKQFKVLASVAPSTTLSVSEEITVSDKDIAQAYKEVLTTLEPGSYSVPIPQKGRDAQKVFRIFYLKDLKKGGPVPFAEVEGKIKDFLLDEAMEKESTSYLKNLRQHFDVQEEQLSTIISEGFEPFRLERI